MPTPPVDPDLIRQAFEAIKQHGSVSAAARSLGIKRTTLDARARKFKPTVEKHQEVHQEPLSKPRMRISSGPIKVLAIGDAHDSPEISDKSRFRWLARWAVKERPSHIIQIGDFLTFDSLSTHTGNHTVAGRHKPSFLQDMESAEAAFKAFDDEIPDGYTPHKHITLGNHEDRLFKFENENPETLGLMQAQFFDLLERHGWSHSSYGAIHFLGGVGFTHVPKNRMGKPYGGKNSEMQIAADSVTDLVFGHSHTARDFVSPKIGPFSHVKVLNLGSAMPQGHIESYAQMNTTGWTWGAYILEIEGAHIASQQFRSMSSLETEFGD